MICTSTVKKFCKVFTKIENYDKAVTDTTQTWYCHHRMELISTGAVCDASMQDLKDWGIYYNRPADELIFLTRSEHQALHQKGKRFSEEHRRKMSEAQKRIKHSGPKGRHWKLVDGKRVWY